MERVHVFDIASSRWYEQETTAEEDIFPRKREEFCAVVASAEDGSSHNIYIYAGWDFSVNSDWDTLTTDVYVLSLPSFHWIPVSRGLQPRTKNKCAKVQQHYLISYRGELQPDAPCDKNQGLQIFDISTLDWTESFTVSGESKYTVPEKVYSIIGGE